jgi:3-methylcrotonyl-CoA carboxylase alpha subunit
MSRAPFIVTIDGRTFTVTRGAAATLEVDGAELAVEPAGANAWRIRSGETSVLAHAILDGDAIWVHANGRTFVADVASGTSPRRTRGSGDEHALTAPMPAAVRAVLVEIGQDVEAGDLLIMLEAMKMELPVRAPRAGTVRAIHCRPGDLVQPGPALAELS